MSGCTANTAPSYFLIVEKFLTNFPPSGLTVILEKHLVSKQNILSRLQILWILATAVITVRMLATARILIIRPIYCCLLLHHKKQKNKKRKSKRKKDTSPEFLSSDPEYSSSSNFQIISNSESHKWELPGEIAY